MSKQQDNINSYFEDMKLKRTKIVAKPQEISLGLTNVCNISCSFCVFCGFCKKKIDHVDMLDMDNLKKLESFIDTAQSVYGSGRGEPLMYDKFTEFMAYCDEHGISDIMQISTNGMALGQYDAGIFSKLNMLTISFDSMEKELFEILRYGANYETVKSNIIKIRNDLPDNMLALTVTVNRLNVDGLYDIYKFAKDNKINAVMFNNVYGPEDDEVIQLLRIRKSDEQIYDHQMAMIRNSNQEQEIRVFEYAVFDHYEDYEARDKEIIFQKLLALKDITPHIDFDAYELGKDDCKFELEFRKELDKEHIVIPYCTQPFHQFIMHADGRIFGCIGDFAALDNCNGKTMEEVWNGENFQLMREAMFNYEMLPQRCKECRKYARYTNLNEYIEYLGKEGVDFRQLVFPPNFNPPVENLKNEKFMEVIKLLKKKNRLEGNGKINSVEYWDSRYSTDWKTYGGNEQTRFFASLLIKMIPEWLVHEINENRYKICDLGCAEGDALPIYKQIFMRSEIVGEDFSEKAIELAKQTYSEFSFRISDILKPENEERYPIIVCSNVVEHFKNTYEVLENICARADKYAVILIPYREKEGKIEEHERIFHTNNIPARVGENYLVYAKSQKCDSIYYPYEQLLLIYAKNKEFVLLSDLIENVSSDKNRDRENSYAQQITEKERQFAEYSTQIEEYKKLCADSEQQLEEYSAQIEEYKKLRADSEQLHANAQNIANETQKQALMLAAVLRQKDEYMLQAQELCNHFATGKLMRLNHFLFRIKGQLLKGTKEDRKDFWSWLKGRAKGTNRTIGAGVIYNPWMAVSRKLSEGIACKASMQETSISNSQEILTDGEGTGNDWLADNLPAVTKQILQQDYTRYDVIILSVIDFNFRHQRPQHFATRFAANGHRVFYVNANFVRADSVATEQENLFVVDFSCKDHNAIYTMNGTDTLEWMQEKFDALLFEQAIRDAIVVVDYPNWVEGAEYLREKYGFKIITDYMDDYTGFLGTAEGFLKNNCVRLLQSSDKIVASSQFLFEVAASHAGKEKIEIIRNGTETEHFYQAVNLETPGKKRKVIGYYGAVAHWFAWEKVCCLAKKFPDCDVVIVGAVTEYKDKLERYNNIKLLGEKPYKELPKYLADFDVCLIPFDTSTDLIKATNPVKFYEYLSAGKKIVSTEIPELVPYRDQYVYMSNDNDTFAEYVRLCLEGQDCLKSKEERIAFARENDWQERYEVLEKACVSCIPKVSIIVLTYNNLELNKQCIDSIFHKTAYGNYELIIVDNASSDGTVEYLRELQSQEIPGVKIILNDQNKGFAGGNNVGIEASSGDYVLLLNNDTVVSRGWLTALVKHLENNEKYAMCNPVTNSIGNESKIKVYYHSLQEMHEFAYKETASKMSEEYAKADRMPLFATLIRKKFINSAGVLDESYKIGMFEDDDYTELVKNAGYGFVIAEDAFIHHINNGAFKQMADEEYQKIFEANKKRFETKWHKKWSMPKYREGVDWDTNEGMRL